MFVLLATANVWLASRSGESTSRAWRLRAHRIIGYLFLFLYCTMMYFMVLRLKGLPDELSTRNLVHALLALLLLPLLVAKVVVARYYRAQTSLLRILGSVIAGISFLVVVMNVGAYLLRISSTDAVSPLVSGAVLVSFASGFGFLLLRRPRIGGPVSAQPPAEKHLSASPGPLILQLARIDRQTHDAKTLRFLIPEEQRFSFRPGQFLTFKWLIDGCTVPRCYSICSSPTQTGYIEITPKQALRGHVSVFLNQHATVGSTVEASHPAGQFYYDEKEHRRIVLIAGGSGITPFVSMLRYIEDRCLPTEVTLLYFVRTRNDVIFEAELDRLGSSLSRFRCVIVLSDPDTGWVGPTGRITRDLIESHIEQLSTSTFFLCGPPGMMKTAHDLLQSMGVDERRLKQESFGAVPPGNPEPRIAQMVMVEFACSKRVQMASSAVTLLETAEACGIRLPYSCRQGQCGTCITKLLSGEVTMMAEDGLAPGQKAQGYILPCVSHAKCDVKLDC